MEGWVGAGVGGLVGRWLVVCGDRNSVGQEGGGRFPVTLLEASPKRGERTAFVKQATESFVRRRSNMGEPRHSCELALS